MRIRLATASDLPAVIACEKLAFNVIAPGANVRDLSENGELACQIREGAIHVILDGTGILGYISFSRNYEHLFVSAIAVLPEHQREGLGRQLLAFAEKEAIRLGLPSVSLFTDGNIAGNLMFYRKNGYQETGRCDENTFSRVFLTKTVVPRVECLEAQ